MDDRSSTQAVSIEASGVPGRLADETEERIAQRVVELVVARLSPRSCGRQLNHDLPSRQNREAEVLDNLRASGDHWRTSREVAAKRFGGVGINRSAVEAALTRLVAAGAVERRTSPPGRSTTAIGYRALVSAGLDAQTTASEVGVSAAGEESPS